MSDKPAPTVVDARGMGGPIAIDGFDYQLWDLIARVPAWVANPAFEQVVFEALEDVEARFFAPQSPLGFVLDRFQHKAATISPADVRKVFESFVEFDTAYPEIARVQTLVTPILPPTLNWVARDPNRVRKVRPFYAPFSKIVEAGDAALRKSFADQYPGPLGEYTAASVEVSERVVPDESTAVHAFAGELDTSFPTLNARHNEAKRAFDGLKTIVRGNVGSPISRDALKGAIEGGLQRPLPLPAAFPLHVRSDRTGRDETCLEVDGTRFSGGDAGYPPPKEWNQGLVGPMKAISDWLHGHRVSRVKLSGSYRLSTAMVLGWCLRSALGFELELPIKNGYWATDDRPTHGTRMPPWQVTQPNSLVGGRLIVAVGVLRYPEDDLPRLLNVSKSDILVLRLEEALTSAKEVQASAGTVKRSVDAAKADLSPTGIDLYFAGPAFLATAIGHRWNAMPSTQLHEYLRETSTYVKTSTI